MRRTPEEQRKFKAAQRREWRRRNPDKAKAAHKRWRLRNGLAYLEKQRKKRAADPDWKFKNAIYRTFRLGSTPCNVTVAQLKAAYTDKCHLCGTPASECIKGLHMDHCHETGAFRGWLCSGCNQGLGMFWESETRLQLAIEYLARNKAQGGPIGG